MTIENKNEKSKVLITGVAEYIGFRLCKLLLYKSYEVIGIDNLNDYYDTSLKDSRLGILQQYGNFKFHKIDLKDKTQVDYIFSTYKPDYVIEYGFIY